MLSGCCRPNRISIWQVTEAKGFGLLGEYFNNRWTFGEPVVTRIDAKVDFSWSETETITPTGQDYISVRCTSLIVGFSLSRDTWSMHFQPYLHMAGFSCAREKGSNRRSKRCREV